MKSYKRSVAVLGPEGLFVTKYFRTPAADVPWPRVNGKPVHTNGIKEDALGLTPLISGWNKQGFYLAKIRGVKKEQLVTHIKTIDWSRVAALEEFAIKMGRGAVCISDSDVYFITERRYARLARHCFKSVPLYNFEVEVDRAKRSTKQHGNISGSLA